ncbi:MAG: ECF-type riboflavin transporter substrate-binding protein [Defluviitaleaceae bacterium]|nr:ECF-type riboflavin transporter substrate-binding protein [Defluviitaleaceae bacterium]
MFAQTLSVKTIVAIGIGTALFFLLARFASIPVFANTTLTFQYALLAFFAVLFGPIAGLIIGLAGHILTDLHFGWGLWWSWIIVSGVVGFAFGVMMKGVNVDEGEFEKKSSIIRFIVCSAIIHVISWGVIAPVLDILIYSQPANRVFTQGLIASIGNIITTAVVGTILLFAYSKAKPKTGSLSKDR